jgi:transcriptional repressor BetI
MARRSKQLVRQKDLSFATMRAIHEAEVAEPTLAQITARAGLSSSSIINHYFSSKQDLLEYTVRELAAGFLGEVALRVGAARTPKERVAAVVDANFAPSQCAPEAVSTWLWFWSRVPINSAYAEIESATYSNVRKELERALAELVPADEVTSIAEAITALMYGLWLRFALDPRGRNVDVARRVTLDTVAARLSVYEGVTAQRKPPVPA